MPANCQRNFKDMFASDEKVKEKTLRQILMDQSSSLHQNICAVAVDVSISLINCVFRELLELLLEKYSEITAFLELACNGDLLTDEEFFVSLCSGMTVIGSIYASLFKSSSAFADKAFNEIVSFSCIPNIGATRSADPFR